MRYNLNTFPRSRMILDYIEWCEGFKAELREIIERYETDPYEEYSKAGVPGILREILGE